MPRRIFMPSSICSAARRRQGSKPFAATGAHSPIRRAPRTLFSSLAQDYVRVHGWGLDRPEGRMIALVGDAELDEGNIFEAMLEGWKQGVRNCWGIIDYNRKSLDAVVREGLWERYENLFRNFGWRVVILKYGSATRHSLTEGR